ncbi:MAG: hypothetical protein DBX37_03100 [Massilioclostridium sp.]|nr:MAG: hypothetical protein DBX37_03100 [Massilioclostridium sp.]
MTFHDLFAIFSFKKGIYRNLYYPFCNYFFDIIFQFVRTYRIFAVNHLVIRLIRNNFYFFHKISNKNKF